MNLSGLLERQRGDQEPFIIDVGNEEFVGERVLRLIPGKRLVASGVWRGQAVVGKFFFNDDGKSASYEARVLVRMAEQGIRVPSIIRRDHHGPHSVLLLEKICGQDLQTLQDEGFDTRLVSGVLDLVWQLFQAGWIQTDLHFGNFLDTDFGLYCIDAGSMKPVKYNDYRALQNNLATFAVQSPLQNQPKLIEEIIKAMVVWGVDVSGFEKKCRGQLQLRIRKADKKWMRSCTAVSVSKFNDRIIYSNRGMEELHGELLPFCDKPDSMPIIKKGSRVSVYSDGSWVLKHYKNMGKKGRLKQFLGRSSAMISWRRGFTWSLLGVPTPKPIILVEFVKGDRAGQSVILFPRFPGLQMSVLMEQQRERANKLAREVREWLLLWKWAGIRHGDMKAQNILVNEFDELCFIDLDASSYGSVSMLTSMWSKKDSDRFEKNWEQFN